MKKLFSIIALCLILMPCKAQSATESNDLRSRMTNKNEIGLSVITGTGLQSAAFQASALVSLIGSLVKNDIYIMIPVPIPFSLEYDHWLNEKVALGVSLNTDIVSGLPYIIVGNISIMPDVKLSWLSDNNLRIYSKLAAGYSGSFYRVQSEDDIRYGSVRSSDLTSQLGQELKLGSWLMFMICPPVGIQLSPFCMDVNTAVKNLDFFCELGVGTLGYGKFGFKMYF